MQQIENTLAASSTYDDGDAQAVITKALLPLATSQTTAAGEFLFQQLSEKLETTLADEKATLFGGNIKRPATEVVRFYLLWAMGLNRQGQVPITLLSEPWTEPQNDREKYWHLAPAAIWAVGEINQNDRATIETLINRLTQKADPLWLRGDAVGALSTLTGEAWGYDIQAWQTWWAKNQA